MKHAQVLYDGEETAATVSADGTLLLAGGGQASEDDIVWLAPLHNSVICTALNSRQHRDRLATQFNEPPHGKPPRYPVFFIKPENTINAHNGGVLFPEHADTMHTGAGLAVVMARGGFHLSVDTVMDHVLGYTIFNDFSLPETSYFRPPITTKCHDSSGPLGPWVVEKGDVADVAALDIRTIINGELKQTTSTADLVHGIPELLAHLTGFMTLRENDVIVCALPDDRPSVRVGDEVIVEIDPIGRLASYIVTEAEYYATGLTA